jgi:hypothetical protein
MPGLDPGIHAVGLMTSADVWQGCVQHKLGRCLRNAVDTRVKARA